MLFRNGEGDVFETWELHFAASFLSIQKATLGTTGSWASFTGMLFQSGEGNVFEARELHFAAGFLALPAAGRGTHPSFTGMLFRSGEGDVPKPWSCILQVASCQIRKTH